MPAKFLNINNKANKEASKLPLHVQDKIDKAFTSIKENPISGKKLHGDLKGYYKFRVGDYRIVYHFDSKNSVVEVVKIEHRQGVYR